MALCDILGCTPNDLIEPVAVPAAKKKAAAGAESQAATVALKGRRPRPAEITKQ